MKVFFLLWILPVTLGDTYVPCIYSEECMLPCSSTHLDIIHWYFNGKVVHSYFYNQDQLGHQHEDYKGRTSLLPESEIKNGNISLLIRNISVQDEGRYKCYAADTNKNDEKYVVMSVEAPVKSVNIRLKDDTVICTSSGVYPEPKVLWYSDPPVMEPPDTTVSRTEDHLYTVTSQLKVDVITDTYTYNCSITTEDTHYTASLKQQAASELPENEFSFECPVPKDFNYTLTLSFSTTILSYDSKTSVKDISEQWRDKVTFDPENGTFKLSHLNREQLGTYTCESTTAQDRYITQTKLPSRGGEIAYIIIGIIAAIIIIAAILFVLIRKKSQRKLSESKYTQFTTDPGHSGVSIEQGNQNHSLEDDNDKKIQQVFIFTVQDLMNEDQYS